MNKPLITTIIPCHNETHVLERAARSVLMQIEPPDNELIFVRDRITGATDDTLQALGHENNALRFLTVDNGDLGLSRNSGIKIADGRFVAFLDADDIFGAKWLRQAFEFARQFDHDDFILHPEWSVMFGSANFVHRHFSCVDPCFDERDLVQYNPWSALAFAPKTVFDRFKYETASAGYGFEDWHFNARTLGAGIKHYVVPEAVHFIRMKQDQTSLARRTVDQHATIRSMPLFDKRNLKRAEHIPPTGHVPLPVVKQALFAHYEVGEKRILMESEMQLQVYPRQTTFDDQAWLRDQIGDSKHVVLVNQLAPGGAEKYAIDWCRALHLNGNDPVIIETEAVEAGPWRRKAAMNARVVPWFRRNHLQPQESKIALQRALVQAQLDSLFVCNAPIGWALLHDNPQALAKRVFAASFADLMLPTGFSTCPPYHNKNAEHFTIITDNVRHCAKLKAYGAGAVEVIEPIAFVEQDIGGPHRSQLTKDRPRVLWAGRGSDEKRPVIAAIVAQLMPEIDVHVWGETNLPRNLPNLHARGAFDGFEKINGAYDVYLLTSIMEGMPNTALEAILCGLPVIGSDVGDVKRIAAITFEAKAHKPIEQHAQNAIGALKAWFGGASETYDHSKPLAMVRGWAESFAGRVLSLVKP